MIITIIEFVRIMDMYKVTGRESLMTKRIKSILKTKLLLKIISTTRVSDINIYYLTFQHIISAALLFGEHLVRKILASVIIKRYFQNDNYKFLKKI
jgi:hypothetical protein